ncbi:MAG: RNB domain-containing ribonuclease [Betaproteobacteria bacterium]|nr:RNB domain-containing ribonuclease [Betaproteobacteria bacterium]
MNVFYEEDGSFKVGTILVDNNTSLQVEAVHGKRSKVKANAVLLRFTAGDLTRFMDEAQAVAASIDPDFLWEVAPPEEFDFLALGREYFGHEPSPQEGAGLLHRLHGSPMHFYKKGKGRYRAAPTESLKAALASAERKRQQALIQAAHVESLSRFELPEAMRPLLGDLLYAPDKNTLEYKALETASLQTGLTMVRLLDRCGAIPSSRQYHVDRFLREHFPHGTGFGDIVPPDIVDDLPLADVEAFSIDDVTTTEIDDALSVVPLASGGWRVGIHIAAPALGIAPDSPIDHAAARRLSTVYMPGDKITMLPDSVIDRFTLLEGAARPAVSLYVILDPDLTPAGYETRVERVPIAANLRHDELDARLTDEALASGTLDFRFGRELELLHRFARRMEVARGKAETTPERQDYNFYVEDDRVRIVERRRGSPVDKLVAEMMIFANAEWGKQLVEYGVPGIYRVQGGGKVRMSLVASPHEGLGVSQYAWSSSPLRRYVDLVNQRQIIAAAQNAPAPYDEHSDMLAVVMRDFEVAYDAYAEFQRIMERYWCLRWLLQENISRTVGVVIRESLVRIERMPLLARVPSLPDCAPGARVEIDVSDVDLLGLDADFRFAGRLPL